MFFKIPTETVHLQTYRHTDIHSIYTVSALNTASSGPSANSINSNNSRSSISSGGCGASTPDSETTGHLGVQASSANYQKIPLLIDWSLFLPLIMASGNSGDGGAPTEDSQTAGHR